METIVIRSEDWLKNAGIIGLYRILEEEESDEKSSISLEEDQIRFSAELLQNFSEKYFRYFIKQYKNVLSLYRTLNFKENISQFKEKNYENFGKEDLEKLNEHVENVKKYLKSNLIPATFPDEIFQFQISYDENEDRWKYLREKIKEKPLIAVPYKDKVYAISTVSTINEVFGNFFPSLFHPREGSAYAPVEYPEVTEIVPKIHEAGGLAVLAPPAGYDRYDGKEELLPVGFDGVEGWHPRNHSYEPERLSGFCREHGLIMTGGTDFHGLYTKKPNPLGTCTTGDDQVELMKK